MGIAGRDSRASSVQDNAILEQVYHVSTTRTVALSGMEPRVRHPRVDGATATNRKIKKWTNLEWALNTDCA